MKIVAVVREGILDEIYVVGVPAADVELVTIDEDKHSHPLVIARRDRAADLDQAPDDVQLWLTKLADAGGERAAMDRDGNPDSWEE